MSNTLQIQYSEFYKDDNLKQLNGWHKIEHLESYISEEPAAGARNWYAGTNSLQASSGHKREASGRKWVTGLSQKPSRKPGS
jgi:hypothetical protein